MEDFIELTTPDGQQSTFIRPESIEMMTHGSGQSNITGKDIFMGCEITLSCGHDIRVRESQDEIIIKLEEYKNQ